MFANAFHEARDFYHQDQALQIRRGQMLAETGQTDLYAEWLESRVQHHQRMALVPLAIIGVCVLVFLGLAFTLK